ncbi:MAG: cation:proton antiporter [Candidatus Hydrogenedentes bacterium]|nr:cation:proton antiporter [Candidatus Hydrogenedentota bacterium]
MRDYLANLNLSSLILVGIATVAGFYFGRLAKVARQPSLVGYMLLGVLLGPSVLGLFPEPLTEQLAFITEIALGFVAFSIGAELNLASLRRLGYGIISIILAESFMAFLLVTAALFLWTRDWPLALIFGAMAPASAPAGTVAVIQEYRAKGSLTQALYAVVGFDDGLAIIIFGFAAALAKNLLLREAVQGGESLFAALGGPAKEIGLSILVGGVAGFIFCQLVRRLTESRDVFIILFGTVLLVTGLSNRWHLSLILTNMVVGFVLVNTRNAGVVRRVTAPLLEVMPLLFILFFFLAGSHLQLAALPALGATGIIYALARSSGLLSGAYLGAVIGRAEQKIRRYLGLGILSQAGVAIGLSLIVKQEFGQLAETYDLPHAAIIGASVLTTITATSILFEIVGPILTKVALSKAGEIPPPARGSK